MRSMSALCWPSAQQDDATCMIARFTLAVLHVRHANPEGVRASRQVTADGKLQPVLLKLSVQDG
jgi:hypothetical protein